MSEVDSGGLGCILGIETLSISVPFPEGLQRRNSFCGKKSITMCM